MPFARLRLFGLAISSHFLATASQTINVVQLGDSYASGNGAGSYEDLNCFRSSNNWGNKMTTEMNNIMDENVVYTNNACSGGRIADMASQDSAVNLDTNLVIIGAGGNDLNFEDIVVNCYVEGSRDTDACKAKLNYASSRMSSMSSDLTSALLDIRSINPNVLIIVVAYPHITLDISYYICTFCITNITPLARNVGNQMDSAQRDAVNNANSAAGTEFVHFFDDTKSLFAGHEPDPNFYSANDDRWIHEMFTDYREEVYHLNPIGHSELGKALAPFAKDLLNDHAPDSTLSPTDPPTRSPVVVATPTFSPTGTPTLSNGVPAPGPSPPLPPSDGGGGGGFCFSGLTEVLVQDKGSVPMAEVQVGDMVLTNGGYQPIYAFAHRHETKAAAFLQLHYEVSPNGDSGISTHASVLEITPEHMVYVQDKGIRKHILVPASSVKVGDILLHHGASQSISLPTPVSVTKITSIQRAGVYAPLTASSTIVANGVLASNYVKTQSNTRNDSPEAFVELSNGWMTPVREADLIHLWMSPLRLVCDLVSSEVCQVHSNTINADGMHPYVASGFRFVEWGEQQAVWLQLVCMFLGITVFSVVYFLEHVLVRSPGQLVAVVMALVWLRASSKADSKVCYR